MAKFKKTAKKGPTRSKQAEPETQAQAERLTRSLSESAQQIWLAGVGAFSRAQSEGTKLFEALVKEGSSLESAARKLAGKGAEDVRGAVEDRVGKARERASDTWDRLEKVFEARVQQALVKLGVPGRDDLHELSARVDALTAELRKQNRGAGAAARKAPAKAKKAASPKASAKTTKMAPRKATRARKAASGA